MEFSKYKLQLDHLKIGKQLINSKLLEERDFMIQAVQISPYILLRPPKQFINDKELLTRSIMRDACILDNYPNDSSFFKDRDIILCYFQHQKLGFSSLSFDIFSLDKELFLDLFLNNGTQSKKLLVYYMSKIMNSSLKNEREIFEIVLKSDGRLLRFLGDELKKDQELIFIALYSTVESYQFICNELKNDFDFVLKIVEKIPNVFEFISEEFKNNQIIAKEAIKGNSSMFKYVSQELKNNKEIIIQALNKIEIHSYNDYDEFSLFEIGAFEDVESIESKDLTMNLLETLSEEFKKDQEVIWMSFKSFCLIRNVPNYNLNFKFSFNSFANKKFE
jgi:hypothetical protein